MGDFQNQNIFLFNLDETKTYIPLIPNALQFDSPARCIQTRYCDQGKSSETNSVLRTSVISRVHVLTVEINMKSISRGQTVVSRAEFKTAFMPILNLIRFSGSA